MGLLRVTSREWKEAESYFKQHADAVKFERKEGIIGSRKNVREHSFIKVNGVIYAKQSAGYLGKGAFGKVKIVQDKAGNNFAVKIEGTSKLDEDHAEQKILQLLGQNYGSAQRKYGGQFKVTNDFAKEQNKTNYNQSWRPPNS